MKEIKTGSDFLNKYEREVRKRKASALLKKKLNSNKTMGHKKSDLKHAFIKQFQKASEKVGS